MRVHNALRLVPAAAAPVLALALAACGSGGPTQAASEPDGHFPVQIVQASFPASQTLSEHTHLLIAVRNSGSKTIPNVAVTVCNVTCSSSAPAGEGTSERAFADASDIPGYDPTNPDWIVDRPPGRCTYSCKNGGKGAGASANANTWALGPLRPGRTRTFEWSLTAVAPGKHVVAWQVAAGLTGRAQAVLGGGGQPEGTFTVTVSSAPKQQYVNNYGKIVNQ